MDIKKTIEELSNNLRRHISQEFYDDFFSETYTYSLFPAGKLFRPLLVWSVAQDFSKAQNKDAQSFTEDHALMASLVETHHTYTLIHDDMPCMDNDDVRRGRPSTHKQFGQWQALLSGDGLLNASYSMFSKMKSKNMPYVLKYSTWALGPKGLILGQALDLSGTMTESFQDLVLTHKLKTARLIQTALLGSYLLIDEENLKSPRHYQSLKKMHKLGEHMGVAFQLLDDLCELVDEELSEHENEVNPWPRFTKQCYNELEKSLNYIAKYFEENETVNLKNIYGLYLKKIKTLMSGSELNIEKHIGTKLNPIISTLDGLSS